VSIPTELRDRSLAVLQRHYEWTGRAQIHIEAEDVARGAWVRAARCGQQNPDAPDPELFFALKADDPATYAAQAFCADCPVRRLCGQAADANGWSGVWGGVYRGDHRLVAPLCSTPGCLRYRAVGRARCDECRKDADAAREAATAAREAARMAAGEKPRRNRRSRCDPRPAKETVAA
jgi:hypothetical protein